MLGLIGVLTMLAGCVVRTPINPHSQITGAPPPRQHHFDRVLIIVLENQNFESAQADPILKELAAQGASFSDFHGLFHPSYPNYLAMISGRDLRIDGINGDAQRDFPDDANHRTIADLFAEAGDANLTWKNYAENYPAKAGATEPFLKDGDGKLYRRKHVPFLSFRAVQTKWFRNVVSVDPSDANNAFAHDARNHNLPNYSFYTPNMENDGHDPGKAQGLASAARWLKRFLTESFPAEVRAGTLIVVTFDESEGREKSNRIYTVFLGDMVKPAAQQNQADLQQPYNHYNVLRTIEDNFGLTPLADGDGKANPITGVWK